MTKSGEAVARSKMIWSESTGVESLVMISVKSSQVAWTVDPSTAVCVPAVSYASVGMQSFLLASVQGDQVKKFWGAYLPLWTSTSYFMSLDCTTWMTNSL